MEGHGALDTEASAVSPADYTAAGMGSGWGRGWGDELWVLDERQRQRQLEDMYEPHQFIGRGMFSEVRQATQKDTGEQVAVKCIRKQDSEQHIMLIRNEVAILRQLDHPNILTIKDVFETRDQFFLVTDLLVGGELFDRICNYGPLPEAAAATMARKIIKATLHMHECGIVHRDLKPENVLFTNYDDDADVKITDFGLAQVWHEGVSEPMATSCGSPGYVAPEVLRCKGYGAECDLWSTGVIIYVCLCGFAPFHDDDKQRLLDQIRSGVFSFPDPFWSDISEEAKDFVSRLLVIHPRQRMTATQCLEHPWLSDDATSDVGSVSPAASEGHDAVLEQVHSNTVPVLGEFVVASPRCLSPVDKLCKSEASVDSDEEKDGMVRAACSSSSGPAGASQARRRLRAAIHAVMLCNSAPSIRKERKLRQLKEMSEKLAAKHHNPMPAEQRDMGS